MGAVNKEAGHNTVKVVVQHSSLPRGLPQRSPLGLKRKSNRSSAPSHHVNRGQGLSLSKCFVYPVYRLSHAPPRQEVGQPAGHPYAPPASRRLKQLQQAVAVRVRYFDMTLHRTPIPNNQKHPSAKPHYASFSPQHTHICILGAILLLLQHDCHTTLDETI